MAQRSVTKAEQFCRDEPNILYNQNYVCPQYFSCVHFGIQIDWAANIRKSWDFSEEGAHARLEAFLHDGETPCAHCK